MTMSSLQPLRVVVVDDERPAREELRRLMRGWSDLQIVGDAATLAEAKKVVAATRPDIVFLDIQLRKQSGFDLLEQLDVDVHVIFVTAYAHHAVRAFDVSAVDYLLKPVEPSRLRDAIDRVRHRTKYASAATLLRADDVLLVKNGRRYYVVRVDRVRYIEAQGEYSEVHACEASGLSNRPLAEWENVLPPDRFVRVHRSTIANLHFVSMMAPADGSSYELIMKDGGDRLVVSRRYAAKIRARLA